MISTILRAVCASALCAATLASFAARAAETPTGFDVSTISRFVEDRAAVQRGARPSLQQQIRLRRLNTIAHLFRRVAAADTPVLTQAFAPHPPGALDALLATKWYARAPAIWRYFFRYTVIHVGRLDAPVSRVGFYNPLVDGWVIADWTWSDADEPRLWWTQVTAGETMRGEHISGADPIAWTTGRRGPVVAAQQAIVAESAAAFASAHPALAASPPPAFRAGPAAALDREMVELRLLVGLLHVNKHAATPEVAALTSEFLDALGAGAEAKLAGLANGVGAQSLHRVAGLSSLQRRRLELAAWYPAPNGGIAIFAVPMVARSLILARYSTGKIAPPKIDGLVVFDPAPGEGGNDVAR